MQNVIGNGKENECQEYKEEKVNDWSRQIIDNCLKDLMKLNKPFKYLVTCIIQQNNGSGLQTAGKSQIPA